MLDGGLKKKARQDKALVDEISATIILQDFMNSIKNWKIERLKNWKIKILKSDLSYIHIRSASA